MAINIPIIIKTINNETILGSGNLSLQPTLDSGGNIKTVGGDSLLGSGDVPLPFINVSEKGATNGVAELNASGILLESQRPSYDTDDITEGTNNLYYPLADKNKLAGIETGAEKNVQSDLAESSSSSDAFVKNKDAKNISYDNGVSQLTASQVKDAIDELASHISSLSNVVILKGNWDASTGSFPSGANIGYSYIVTDADNGETISGVEFKNNDRIVAIADNASTTVYAGNWLKLDYTDNVLSVAGKTGAVTLDANDVSENSTKKWAGETGANVNVQSDYNQTNTSADDYIKNKLGLGVTAAKAYRGDRGKIAYDHSQETSGNPHKVTLAESLVEGNKTGANDIGVSGSQKIYSVGVPVNKMTPNQGGDFEIASKGKFSTKSGIRRGNYNVKGPYTIKNGDHVLFSNVTVTLPYSHNAGDEYILIGITQCALACTNGNIIGNGFSASSKIITTGQSITVISDGYNWYITTLT